MSAASCPSRRRARDESRVVLAGMLMPAASVSVANTTLISPAAGEAGIAAFCKHVKECGELDAC